MPISTQLSGKADSLINLCVSGCWPSWRTTVEDALSEKSVELVEPALWEAMENPAFAPTDDRVKISLRKGGYGLVISLFHTIEHANVKLITAQWQQYAKELYELRVGDRDISEVHNSPNDIKLFGESYGSLSDQLMEVMSLINMPDSPFHMDLPRLSKANDKIPTRVAEELKKHPILQQKIGAIYEHAKLERMLDNPLTKAGGGNALTTEKINQQIQALEQFLPRARELDEVNHYLAAYHDRTDQLVFTVEDLQAGLSVIKNHLQAHEAQSLAKGSKENMALLLHGGKA